ncbi:phage GP46 family protein [Gluconacetobacter diazotrophicus]|uniref:phage GP46 family protein n=1 Tax=Gluconacetobacter diazotrophicus TaxID=33996 RepID=UPI000173B2FC|nr:phage GP46 family protein [Gluconacetobacter diazotrophicus]
MDINLSYDNATQAFDWVYENGDFCTNTDDLASAVQMSLFTWGHATDGWVNPDGSGNMYGNWIDSEYGFYVGSRIYQLWLEGITTDDATVAKTNDIVNQSLAWMLSQDVASAISVNSNIVNNSQIEIDISITKPTGQVSQYSYVWGSING